MHDSYFSSVHCSFRSNGYVPFASNNYSHLLLNQRCDATSFSCCCCRCRCHCCSTCSSSTGMVTANRSLLYGLRQSNLLHWSASKRLMLGGGDRVYYQVLSYGRDRGCYDKEMGFRGRFGMGMRGGAVKCLDFEEDCGRFEFSGKESGFNGRIGRRIRGGDVKCVGFESDGDRFEFGSKERSSNRKNGRRVRGISVKCRISEEETDGFPLDGFGAVDEIINLLTEEVGDECFVSREGKGNVSKRVDLQKRGKCGGDSFRSKSRIAGSGSVENDSKSGFEVVMDDMREEESRENKENRTNVWRDKNRRERKENSSSSYYSLSSAGDFEHDMEAEENYGRKMESTKKHEDTGRTRHKVSTSRIQRDDEISRKQLVREREHCEQRSSTQQDLSQSQNKHSNFRPAVQPQIRTTAEILKQERCYRDSGSGSSASQLHVDENDALHKGQYGTGRSEAYGKPTPGSVLIDKSTTHYVQKEGQYKQKRSSQYAFESNSSGKNSLNEVMSGTASQNASVSRIGASALNSQSERVTALHQERYREKKDETFRELVNPITDDTAQSSAGHLKNSSMEFVGAAIENESQYKLKKSTQYDLEHTSKDGSSMQSELMSKSSMKEAPVGASGSGSSVFHYHGGVKAFHQGLHIREDRDQGQCSGHLTHDDALDSVRNMERSSIQFVGDFIEKARSEISTTEVKKDRKNFQSELAYEKEVRELDGSQGDQRKEPDSRHTTKDYGTKGPSDEMWNVVEPPFQEASHEEEEEEEEEAITTDNAVVRRTGKSFWSTIADVVHLRWGSRPRTSKSSGKSDGKSPSNESASNETWFTGREHERSDEDTKGGRRNLPLAIGSQLQQEEFFSPNSGVIKARGEVRYGEVQASSSSSPLETGSATKDISLTSPEENADWDKNGKSSRTSLSGMDIIESSLPLSIGESKVSSVSGETAETVRTQAPGICSMERMETVRSEASRSASQMRESGTSRSSKTGSMEVVETGTSEPSRTDPIKVTETGRSESSKTGSIKIIETGRSEPSRRGLTQQQDQLGSTKLIEASISGERDVELKRRKLQRNKQVLRDRFDEWEEACRLDIEQRNMDEMFMKEALIEAQKAADSWEVPVGAVLVQHGKIIARGCNLVEELRDSTAHAEMICIREGSNLLQSWRLAETTLYVTLEPCPMCAGAIMQARIDTVVWGAPNKLLGADGSWIRLFPDAEGGNGSESAGKPAAPVHPFHPKMTIRRGVLASECAEVMQQFFQLRRRKKVKKAEPPKENKPETSSPLTRSGFAHHPSKFLAKMHQIFHIFC